MKRKLLTLMTALAVVLTLAACDEPEDDTPITRVTTTAGEQETEVTEQSTETETSAETDETDESATEPVTDELTEEPTEPVTEETAEETTAEPEETEHAPEEGIARPEGDTEDVSEEEAATMMLVAGDWLNDDAYAEGITKETAFKQLEAVKTYRAEDALYLEAYVLNYEPIYNEDGFFVGIVSADGHGIGYYSLLGETETLKEYRLYPLEGLPVSIFRLLEMEGEGALYVDGHGTFGEDEETVAAHEEFPLTREGARQEVYTASGFNLNMRDLPSVEGEAITSLPVGAQVYAIDFNEAQFVLAITEDNEYLGFVSGEFLINPGEAPEVVTEETAAETSEEPEDTEASEETAP